MLAGSRYFKSLAFLSPPSSQLGMQAKTGLILENDGFIVLEAAEFFLTLGEIDGHPWHEPEDKHSRLASNCNLSDVASIVLAVLLDSLQSASSDVSPESVHPRRLSGDQIPEEVFADLALDASSLPVLVELDGPAEVRVSELGFLPDLHH